MEENLVVTTEGPRPIWLIGKTRANGRKVYIYEAAELPQRSAAETEMCQYLNGVSSVHNN